MERLRVLRRSCLNYLSTKVKFRTMAKGENKKTKNKKVKSCTLYVEGMHCASCEVLIEKSMLEDERIEAVDASLKGQRVEVDYVGRKPDVEKLNEEFAAAGYKFSDTPVAVSAPLISFGADGQMEINPEKLQNLGKAFLVFIGLISAFFAFEGLQLGQYVSVDANSSLPAFFALGLIAGFSSCAALVGGLLLSMVKQWNELYINSESRSEKAQPHILFHAGRVVSFTVLGGVLGLIGETLTLDNPVFYVGLTVLISVLMLVLALQMLGVEWAQQFKFAAPKFMTRFIADESNFQGRYMPFLIGSLTFFLPCGFTLIAQSIALASGSVVQGAAIMLLFALGTLIPLAGISFSGLIFNSKPQMTARFNLIAGLVIVFFVLYNVNGQLNVLGLPSLSDISLPGLTTTVSAPAQATSKNEDGVQVLSIVAAGFSYTPTSSTTLKAGQPAKLVVDNRGIQGCGSFMASTGLIDGFVSLKKGINQIDLGSPKAGTYKLTCTMGMVPPVTITVV